MTDQQMKQAWLDLAERVSVLERKMYINTNSTPNYNHITALDSLASKYKRFAIVGLVMIVFSLTNYLNPSFLINNRLLICLYMAVYFAVVSCMDFWLYGQIKDIDITAMSVSEVAERAQYCRKRHLQFMAILIPLAVIFLILMAYSLWGNTPALIGMSVGAVVGLIIGINLFLRIMSDYRRLS